MLSPSTHAAYCKTQKPLRQASCIPLNVFSHGSFRSHLKPTEFRTLLTVTEPNSCRLLDVL